MLKRRIVSRNVTLSATDIDRIHRAGNPSHRRHWSMYGWDAVLSVEPSGRVWPTPGYGLTPQSEREYIDDDIGALRVLATRLLRRRRLGGRLFFKGTRVFTKNRDGEFLQLAELRIVGRARALALTH